MFILYLLIIISLGINSNRFYVYAETDEECYARIMFEQVYFYRQPIDDNTNSNIYFELPKTYFVKLLDRANDNYYVAEYYGIQGYVKRDSVRAISGTPSNPYLTNINFRIYADQSRDMRSYPAIDNSLGDQVTYIPLYNKNIEYLGPIKGQELILNRTNIWYYCKYTADKDYYGYIYSDFCDEMSPIYENNEQVTYITNPTFVTEQTNSPTITDSKLLGIIIAIMAVPTIAFIFLVMRGKHILSYQKSKHEVIDY